MRDYNKEDCTSLIAGIVILVIILLLTIRFIVYPVLNSVISFLVDNSGTIFGTLGLILVFIISVFVIVKIHEKVEKEKKLREQLVQLQQQARWFQNTFQSAIIDAFPVIDSNIWMNNKYEIFFDALQCILSTAKKIVVLYGPQFDEICNIKKKYDYDDLKNRRARCAINRVESFQVSGLLEIRPMKVEADSYAYVDPLIIKLLLTLNRKGKNVSLLTDDKELRIRARQLLSDQGKAKFEILDVESVLNHARAYCIVNNIKLTNNTDGFNIS